MVAFSLSPLNPRPSPPPPTPFFFFSSPPRCECEFGNCVVCAKAAEAESEARRWRDQFHRPRVGSALGPGSTVGSGQAPRLRVRTLFNWRSCESSSTSSETSAFRQMSANCPAAGCSPHHTRRSEHTHIRRDSRNFFEREREDLAVRSRRIIFVMSRAQIILNGLRGH